MTTIETLTPAFAVLEYLSGERRGIKRSTMKNELFCFGAYGLEAWPKLTSEQWNKHIDDAIQAGGVEERDGKLRLVRKPVVLEKQDVQMGLF